MPVRRGIPAGVSDPLQSRCHGRILYRIPVALSVAHDFDDGSILSGPCGRAFMGELLR